MATGFLMILILALLIALSYLVLIAIFTFGWCRKPGPETGPGAGYRKISVVVAARNEESNMAGLLNDLIRQDYPGGLLEIIIVDDHSTDRTAGITRNFIQDHPLSAIIFILNNDEEKRGKKASVELGISRATGEIIVTTDADCRMREGWIRALAGRFTKEHVQMVFGPVTIGKQHNFAGLFQAMEFDGLVASGGGAALAGYPFLCNGANLAYRREAFHTTGGFSDNMRYISGDDVFLLHKIKKQFGAGAIVFCKDEQAIVDTAPVSGAGAFLRQRIRWASKSKGYRDSLSIITAITIFSFSLTVLLSFLAGFTDPMYFSISGGLFLLKIFADLPLLAGITKFTGKPFPFMWYPVFQLIYPLYIIIAGILSLSNRNKW
ncbi:MAG: glycosyltransferase [Bacteroidales bacterium]|nr:glycosyltransferase [Bacteroidales bacterium]